MPVYNEKKTIGEIIPKVLSRPEVHELIVVDDGSTDGTREKLAGIKHKKLKLIFHKKNSGKGAAIKTALAKASGSHVIIQDADLEYDPEDYKTLVEPVVNHNAEVVFGSRFYGPHRDMLFWHKAGNDLLNFFVNVLFDTTISDCETGYKLLPLKLLKDLDLKTSRFDFEIETTCKVLKRNIRIFEVPVSYTGREYADGKKIRFSDAVIAFLRIVQYRFLEN